MDSALQLHSDSAEDVTTSSSFRQFKIKHLNLDLIVDFHSRNLRGTETLEIICLLDSQNKLYMDIHPSLKLQDVLYSPGNDPSNWVKTKFLIQDFTSYGTTLVVEFPSPLKIRDEFHLLIKYIATNGPGLCWLEPEQTAGKIKPYLFTQGQAALNRSFFPCFDTPLVKSTYSASIQVPNGFTALMSATKREHRKADNSFLFTMEQPVPSYLVALAVGDLVSAQVGPRSHVWSEPCLLQAAQQEYEGVIEEFLAVGEQLFGPYVWGRYDVLFMPPSFPYGGMENPCLTFVTPCLLPGDRSLAHVIIHEICHSWFGNLVTNATWGDFWINEGFTMYAQRRVCREIYGEAYTCLEASTGRALLRQHLSNTGDSHPLNKLQVKIEPGMDPDDTYNETAYEKGFCFVSYLAHLAGDQSRFDAFLRAYIKKFKFRSIVGEDVLQFYLEYFPDLKEKNVYQIKGLEFERWLNTSGWPPYLPDLSPGLSLMNPAEQLAEQWTAESLDLAAIGAVDIQPWKTYQTVYFLDKVLEKSPLSEGTMEKFEKQYPHVVRSNNAELRLRWAQIVVRNEYEPGYQHVQDFLSSQGKQKYTLPVYQILWNTSEKTRALATEIFFRTSHQLHVTLRNYVKRILT